MSNNLNINNKNNDNPRYKMNDLDRVHCFYDKNSGKNITANNKLKGVTTDGKGSK